MIKSVNQFIGKTKSKFLLKIPNLETFENFRKKSNLATFILAWIALIFIFEIYLFINYILFNGDPKHLFEPFLFINALTFIYIISHTRFFRLNIYLFILFLAFYMNLQLYFERDLTSHLFLFIGLGVVIQLLASYFLSLKQSFFIPLADNIISTIHLLMIPEYSNYGVLGLFQTLLFLDVAIFIMNFYYQTGLLQMHAYSNQLEQEKLVSENALNTKNKFLSKMSHELRTPLNIISGSIETLQAMPNNENNEEKTFIVQEKFLKMIKKSNIELTELINNLIVYSEIDENLLVSLEFFDINSLIKEIFDFFKIDAGKNVDFSYQVEIPYQNMYLRSDSYLLKRIISNVISNSIKNTSKGYIKLFANVILLNKSKARLTISVQDSGSGFEYVMEKNRFLDLSSGLDNQVNIKDTKGIGLGLSIIKELAVLLDGNLKIESELNKETKISLTFELDFKTNLENKSQNKRVIKLLIGEDDLGNQELLKYLLEENNYLFEIYGNGKEVLEFYQRKNHSEYNIILMDIRMPVMDGITAVKAIRQFEKDNNLCKIPIIAVTAHALKDELLKTLDAGCNAYITKPYEFKDLKIMIERFSKKCT